MVWVYNFYTLLCLLHTQWVTWSIAFTARFSLRALPSPNSQHWYNKPSTRSSRYAITFKDARCTRYLPLVVAHSSLTTSRSLTGRDVVILPQFNIQRGEREGQSTVYDDRHNSRGTMLALETTSTTPARVHGPSHYPPLNSQHWYNKPSTRSSRYVITFKDARYTRYLPLVVAHSSLTTSRSLTGRGCRRCYPATIQYPGERRSKHCVRRWAQLPRDACWHCPRRRGRSSKVTNLATCRLQTSPTFQTSPNTTGLEMFSTSQPGSLFVHYPPLNTQLALIQHAVHTFVSLRHHIQGRAHHCTRYLPPS